VGSEDGRFWGMVVGLFLLKPSTVRCTFLNCQTTSVDEEAIKVVETHNKTSKPYHGRNMAKLEEHTRAIGSVRLWREVR